MSTNSPASDCCHICKSEFPPSSHRKVQPGRSAKSKTACAKALTDWIQCDVCKNWCHCDCCGLTSRDYKKLTSSVQQYYKCIVCCIAASYCITDVTYRTKSDTDVDQTVSEFHPDHSCSSANKISDQQASAVGSLDTLQASVGDSDSIDEQEERKNIILVDNIRYPVQFI